MSTTTQKFEVEYRDELRAIAVKDETLTTQEIWSTAMRLADELINDPWEPATLVRTGEHELVWERQAVPTKTDRLPWILVSR